tara:strand:- start:136 stop:369 length:234 start_codon:yes stop_codon:yes gene_type:complete
MSIPLNVWYYNDLLNDWILKLTNDFVETKDEYKYFRVISNGKKYFYSSSKDYFLHNKDYILFDDNIYDVNNNLIYNI